MLVFFVVFSASLYIFVLFLHYFIFSVCFVARAVWRCAYISQFALAWVFVLQFIIIVFGVLRLFSLCFQHNTFLRAKIRLNSTVLFYLNVRAVVKNYCAHAISLQPKPCTFNKNELIWLCVVVQCGLNSGYIKANLFEKS